MSPKTYNARLAALKLSQEAAGEYFGYSKRTGQRWASDGPPLAVAMALTAARTRKELDDIKRKAT